MASCHTDHWVGANKWEKISICRDRERERETHCLQGSYALHKVLVDLLSGLGTYQLHSFFVLCLLFLTSDALSYRFTKLSPLCLWALYSILPLKGTFAAGLPTSHCPLRLFSKYRLDCHLLTSALSLSTPHPPECELPDHMNSPIPLTLAPVLLEQPLVQWAQGKHLRKGYPMASRFPVLIHR
jgi:hypothetical protein